MRPLAHPSGVGGRREALLLLSLVLAVPPACAQDSPHGELRESCDRCHTSNSWSELAQPLRFSHARTSFPLEGQHAAVSCRSCHASLRFAEAPAECRDCHEDVHRGELGMECQRCHEPDSWLVPDMPQRHASTRFPLLGAHVSAACQSCHPNQQRNEYIRISMDCYSCHSQDYQATLAPAHAPTGIGTDCENCHSVSDPQWEGSFDHGRTAFPLTGAHQAVVCSECHQANRFRGTPSLCYSCHADDFASTVDPAHVSGGFSTGCVACHSTSAWRPASFDHNSSGFPLTGAHVAVPCNECHAGGRYAGTPSQCAGCHQEDYNQTSNPAHAAAGFPLDCQSCHGTASWQPASFNHEPLFPIAAGTSHSPGRWSACSDCHTVASNYKAFSCLTCHAHAQSSMDSKHSDVSRYQYESQACFQCHPRGRGD